MQNEHGQHFLSFHFTGSDNLEGDDWKTQIEGIAARYGVAIPETDLSDSEMLLLVMVDREIGSIPPFVRERLGQVLVVPAKAKKDAERLWSWLRNHWHVARVRSTLHQLMQQYWGVPSLHRGELNQSEVAKALGQKGMYWERIAYAAATSPNQEAGGVAREVYGHEQWDRTMEAMRREVGPILWGCLTRQALTEALSAYTADQQIKTLNSKVETLSYASQAAAEKHQKATTHLRDLNTHVTQLEGKVATLETAVRDKEEHIRALQENFDAERRQYVLQQAAWADLVSTLQAALSELRSGRAPLAGKRVAIIGGDPMADATEALVRAWGGEPKHYKGCDEQGRIDGLAQADVYLIIRAFMSHTAYWKACSAIDQMIRAGLKAQMVYVNHSGMGTFRRALEQVTQQRAA